MRSRCIAALAVRSKALETVAWAPSALPQRQRVRYTTTSQDTANLSPLPSPLTMEDQGTQEMTKGAGDVFCGSWCRFNAIFMLFFPFQEEIISMRVLITDRECSLLGYHSRTDANQTPSSLSVSSAYSRSSGRGRGKKKPLVCQTP